MYFDQIVKFLFVPEADLAVLFLLFFVLDFAWGIYLYRKNRRKLNELREDAVDEYEKVAKKMPPEAFLHKRLDTMSADEGTLAGIPDVFVSMGILATFIGLGVAIQGAAELLSEDKIELAKLTGVLGVIAFKFQTSVWGIAFSLAFRRIAVDGYFGYRQKVVDSVRELLYAAEQNSIRTLLDKQNDFFSHMFAWQKEDSEKRLLASRKQCDEIISALLSGQQEAQMRAEDRRVFEQKQMDALMATMEVQNKTLIDIVQELSLVILDMGSQVRESLGEKIGELQRNLAANDQKKIKLSETLLTRTDDFVRTAQEFAEAEKGFEQSVNELANGINVSKRELQATFKNEFARMREVSEALGKRQDDQVDRLNEEQTLNLMKLTEGLDALHHKFYQDGKRAAIDTQKILLDRTNDALQEIRSEYIREVRHIGQTVENTQGIIAATGKIMEDMQDKFNVQQKKFLANQAEAYEQMKVSMAEVENAAKFSIKEMDATMKEVRNTIEGMKNAQDENTQSFASLMAETTEHLMDMIVRLEVYQKDDRKAHREALKDISSALTKAQAESAKYAADTAKAIDAMTKELAALVKIEKEEPDQEGNLFTSLVSRFGDKK